MKMRKFFSLVIVFVLSFSLIPVEAIGASKDQITLTFSDEKIMETIAGKGYSIGGTVLEITANGTYEVTGSSTSGCIEVAKGLNDVTLILDHLTLANSETAPIIVKKNSSVVLKLVGESTITNNEDSQKETSDPDNFEGAAIKVKSSSTLTISGDGVLNVVGNTKNAMKGGACSSLIVNDGTIHANATNNGIGFDGSILINAGTLDIAAGNDGLKSEPDEEDTESAGSVTINDGNIKIVSQGDGIQAAKELTINGGIFTLTTADDAIHSDEYCDILGGTFNINAGDDGVHASSTLTLGKENGYERDPEINIHSSYEGLEGITINAYSGKYYVNASDDGVNAAGGSSNGSNANNQDSFNPGGQRPGQGGSGPGGQKPGQEDFGPGGNNASGNYVLNIYGGKFYVNCEGDGLDSNGALNLLGGDVTVLSMRAGGDNSPLDADGSITINGATVFAAGSRGMGVNLSGNSQSAYTNSSSFNANTVINISSAGNVVRSEKLVRNINYLLYSAPDMGSCSASKATSVEACKSNAFAHNWDNGVIEQNVSEDANGLIKYTCQDCNAIEHKTLTKHVKIEDISSSDNNIDDTDNTDINNNIDDTDNTDINTNIISVKILDLDKKEVSYVGNINNKQKIVKVPNVVTINGVKYSVVMIEDNALKGNKVVTKIILPNTIKSIGKNAFRGCSSLTRITIPKNIEKIGAYAFYGCKKLKKIVVKTTKLVKKNVGKKAFKKTPKSAKMKVIKKKLKAYKKLFKSKGFRGIFVC